jgi:hypothetical protein
MGNVALRVKPQRTCSVGFWGIEEDAVSSQLSVRGARSYFDIAHRAAASARPVEPSREAGALRLAWARLARLWSPR